MTHQVARTVMDCLDNEKDNGYAHDLSKTPKQYVEQIVDYSGNLHLYNSVDMSIAEDAVSYWRKENGYVIS